MAFAARLLWGMFLMMLYWLISLKHSPLPSPIANAGDKTKALILAQEAVDLHRRARKSFNKNIVLQAYKESVYAEALINLASRSAVVRNLDAPQTLLNEAKKIFQNLTVDAPGYFSLLTKTLDLIKAPRQ